MPATAPAFLIHTNDSFGAFGLESEPAMLWLHSVEDSANRRRVTLEDKNLGVAILESFQMASASYHIDSHVKTPIGIGNAHPGTAINAGTINAVTSETPFQFSQNGIFIFSDPKKNRTAGEFHQLQFSIEHIFPEGFAFSAQRTDDTNDPITLDPDLGNEGLEGSGSIDPGTGLEALRTLRLHYHFTPARGNAASEREGFVTRFLGSTATPSMAEIYSWDKPPGEIWQSTPCDHLDVGPDWSSDDPHATLASAIPGNYLLTGVYELESDTWLLTDASYPGLSKYDSATHGTDIIVVWTLAGVTTLLTGNFSSLAAVLTHLSLADATTLQGVFSARTNTYLHGSSPTPDLDSLLWWRIGRAQPVAGNQLQIYEIMGTRTPTGKFRFTRVSKNNFDLDSSEGTADFPLPNPPPGSHWNLPGTGVGNDIATVDVIYNHNDDVFDLGDAGVVSSLGQTAIVAGAHLWIFKYKTSPGAYSQQWDYRLGPYTTATQLWNALGYSGAFSTSNTILDVLFHANNGFYSQGNAGWGDPFLSTTGIDLY